MSIRFGSICSGIEAATVAWQPLNWTPQWYAEVDPFCRDLLSHHYPDTYCYLDLNDITNSILEGDPDNAPEPIDLLVAGTPCQDYSIAGGRAGLDGDRGDVTMQWIRLISSWPVAQRPRWIVWENVFGVLSLGKRRGAHKWWTFAKIISLLAGYPADRIIRPGKDKWRSSGVIPAAHDGAYSIAWRILDAQYFGVPQRRRRVFIVGHIGTDWRRAAAVLFESPSLPRNTPKSKRKGTAVAALTSTGVGTCGADDNQGQAGHLIAHTLRGEGFDASEDGTGRGTPLVPTISYTLNAKGGSGCMDGESETLLPIWLNGHQDPITAPQCGPLDTDPNTNVVAFNLRGRDGGAQPEAAPGNVASLRASNGGSSNSYIAFDPTQITSPDNRSNPQPGDPCHTMPTQGRPPHIVGQVGVRRITPTEAERLQGFPDGYTLIPGPNGKPPADGPRYRALGNSMAVPCMAWIGRRIDLMERLIRRGLG